MANNEMPLSNNGENNSDNEKGRAQEAWPDATSEIYGRRTESDALEAVRYTADSLSMLSKYVEVVPHKFEVSSPDSKGRIWEIKVSQSASATAGGQSVAEMLQTGAITPTEAANIGKALEGVANYTTDAIKHGGDVDQARTEMSSFTYVNDKVVMTQLAPSKWGHIVPVPAQRNSGYQFPFIGIASKIGTAAAALREAVPGSEQGAFKALENLFGHLASDQYGPPSVAMNELLRQAKLAIERGDGRFFAELTKASPSREARDFEYLRNPNRASSERDPLGYIRDFQMGAHNSGAFVLANAFPNIHMQTLYTVTGTMVAGSMVDAETAKALNISAEAIRVNRELEQGGRGIAKEVNDIMGGRGVDKPDEGQTREIGGPEDRDDRDDPGSGGTPVGPEPPDTPPPTPAPEAHPAPEIEPRDVQRQRDPADAPDPAVREKEQGGSQGTPEKDSTNGSSSATTESGEAAQHRKIQEAQRAVELALERGNSQPTTGEEAVGKEKGTETQAPESTASGDKTSENGKPGVVLEKGPGESTAVEQITQEARALAEATSTPAKEKEQPMPGDQLMLALARQAVLDAHTARQREPEKTPGGLTKLLDRIPGLRNDEDKKPAATRRRSIKMTDRDREIARVAELLKQRGVEHDTAHTVADGLVGRQGDASNTYNAAVRQAADRLRQEAVNGKNAPHKEVDLAVRAQAEAQVLGGVADAAIREHRERMTPPLRREERGYEHPAPVPALSHDQIRQLVEAGRETREQQLQRLDPQIKAAMARDRTLTVEKARALILEKDFQEHGGASERTASNTYRSQSREKGLRREIGG